ncbi:Uncharacterized protein conserved in bacteria [Salmonella enterica subsp. arizonae]|uniref:Uncharacterized protein conserved in bacteria n=1 Tax=Salmonella enterica subsp. arizonae TaxID=59203 RepID=A0A379SUP3_SALER|nr:Uncharacterized protein conserved in bacteria [Salmonella enterica subsp. arizonae]SUG38237.1 Uncharacterized protein conserved in bacteria [Salmonella enterica subsp. arizonae]VEA47199.1 Uncharacterized protein conserved in bacteria [Salmonella enterica subsp. arizonae]
MPDRKSPSLYEILTGFGLTQTVTDGTVSITKSIFYKKIKTLHLDFTPRTAINADGAQTPLATMVRVYQLKFSRCRSNMAIRSA